MEPMEGKGRRLCHNKHLRKLVLGVWRVEIKTPIGGVPTTINTCTLTHNSHWVYLGK
jgi:hypothetical protein